MTARAIALIVASLLSGCRNLRTSSASPVIEFSSVPLAGVATPEKLSPIKGRVINARPGQQIVLYAKDPRTWWVQPYADHPFTEIQANFEWNSETHPGTDYAALLVGPDFHPPPTTDVLPTAGVFAVAVTHGALPFWERWWFLVACGIAGALAIIGLYGMRLYQMKERLNIRFEERLAERMRVAQELHDTLLQGVLSASMQLHVAVEQLPPDSPAQPALHRILQLMGQVVEEGRNTVRGLRSPIASAHDLEQSFSRIPQELNMEQDIKFRVIVEGSALPLQAAIRTDVYNIGREALLNAFRHSGASNVEVQLEYAANQLRVLVRDNGCGIDPRVLQSGRDGHWGLSGMRERAERIGAGLKVLSSADNGTEIELRIPGRVAFESPPSSRTSVWFAKLSSRRNHQVKPAQQKKRAG